MLTDGSFSVDGVRTDDTERSAKFLDAATRFWAKETKFKVWPRTYYVAPSNQIVLGNRALITFSIKKGNLIPFRSGKQAGLFTFALNLKTNQIDSNDIHHLGVETVLSSPLLDKKGRIDCDVEGAARELVGRSLRFCAQNGYPTLQVDKFAGDSALFWFGMGFNPIKPLALDWSRIHPGMGDVVQDGIKWKKMLHTRDGCCGLGGDVRSENGAAINQLYLWTFVNTSAGRIVLEKEQTGAIADLRNSQQRGYLAKQLGLKEADLKPR